MTSVLNELKQAQNLLDNSFLDEAKEKLKFLQKKYPSEVRVVNLLGQVYLRQKDFTNAVTCFEKSLRYSGKDSMINFFLAISYEGLNQRKKALEFCKKSIQLDGKFGLGFYNLARMLILDGQNMAAMHYFKKALDYIQDNGEIYASLACVQNEIGLWQESSRNFETAYELTGNKSYLSTPLFMAHKDLYNSPKDLRSIAEDYYKRVLKSISSNKYDHSAKQNSKKTVLKVGFFSADYKAHPVGLYMKTILEHIDKNKIQSYLYYNFDQEDIVTERIKANAHKFYFVSKMTDEEVADLIYADDIDILVDLAGYTFGERLEIVVRRPAPVQVAHLGFPGTLGIPEIDFLIADNNVVKPGEDQYYTEKLYRMPHVFTHCKLQEIPETITELPYKKNGYITFGSLNTLHKITEEVMLAWAEIMNAIPNSQLLIDSRVLRHEANQKMLFETFAKGKITKDRIKIKYSDKRGEFLDTYNHIDIALDPFPYTGGTSTIESLMMGVPLVTVEGDRWISRMSATKLKGTGHEELIAQSIQEYKTKYIELAQDISRLENYRNTLRQDLINSGMNINRYIKDLEQAFFDMWNSKMITE